MKAIMVIMAIAGVPQPLISKQFVGPAWGPAWDVGFLEHGAWSYEVDVTKHKDELLETEGRRK